jgi:predicted ATP-grasp superfamily ATP-dependent carboligase
VVVVGLDCITGLQTARIFARRGVPVIGIVGDARHFCSRTRVCDRIVPTDTRSEHLVETLLDLVTTLPDRAVLVPCTDLAVLLISAHRDALAPHYHVVLPPHDVVETLTDKTRFYRFAAEHGLLIPPTMLLESHHDADDAARSLSFPAIVKPATRSATWQAAGLRKVYRVEEPRELLAVYERAASHADGLIVQQWIPGEERELYSCNCYVGRDGRLLASFVARKIRQWPPEAGTSSLGEEVCNDVVLQQTTRLFTLVPYFGLGYLEMKRDARTGEHFIIEPNIGRPTGRSAIAELGGVELLATMYSDVLGLPLPEQRRQRYRGTKWVYLRHDVQAAVSSWRRGDLTVSGWARSWRGVRTDAVFDPRDPLPFWLDLWHTARKVVRGTSPSAAGSDGPDQRVALERQIPRGLGSQRGDPVVGVHPDAGDREAVDPSVDA